MGKHAAHVTRYAAKVERFAQEHPESTERVEAYRIISPYTARHRA